MKSLLAFLTILSLFFIGVSCTNSNDSTPMTATPIITTFMATLTPPTGVTSTASGSAKLVLNETTKIFEITVSYTGLTPTHGHIHSADGNIQIPFSDSAVMTSPFVVTGTLTDAQLAGLMTGTYYVNLHTVAYPNGEISGTLTKSGSTGGGSSGGGY